MNDKEVIERLNRFKTIKVMYGNTFTMHLEQLKQLQQDLETILNILENQKVEISDLKWKNEIYVKSIKSHDRYEIELNDEIIEKNNKIFDLEAEIENKDKEINLMAEWIEKHTKYYDEDGCYCEVEKDICNKNIECDNCIKQYFEYKVEEDK